MNTLSLSLKEVGFVASRNIYNLRIKNTTSAFKDTFPPNANTQVLILAYFAQMYALPARLPKFALQMNKQHVPQTGLWPPRRSILQHSIKWFRDPINVHAHCLRSYNLQCSKCHLKDLQTHIHTHTPFGKRNDHNDGRANSIICKVSGN